MAINVDVYYKGVAGERIQELSDRLLQLSQQAEREDAQDAALCLADAATQLLDVGVEVAGKRIAVARAAALSDDRRARDHLSPL